MPRTYTKVERPYTTATIELAVQEVKDGSSIRVASAKYHMSYSLLRKHVKRSESQESSKDDMRVSYYFLCVYVTYNSYTLTYLHTVYASCNRTCSDIYTFCLHYRERRLHLHLNWKRSLQIQSREWRKWDSDRHC